MVTPVEQLPWYREPLNAGGGAALSWVITAALTLNERVCRQFDGDEESAQFIAKAFGCGLALYGVASIVVGGIVYKVVKVANQRFGLPARNDGYVLTPVDDD